MSAFNLRDAVESAKKRMGDVPLGSKRKPRSDRGAIRIDPAVIACLSRAASGMERPKMKEMLAALSDTCKKRGIRCPSRASVYKLLYRLPVPLLRIPSLPRSVREALYNLDPEGEVPAHQLAFYCFNYGTTAAVSFAAGLPWLAIFQAVRMRGYRAKSRGLALAVARARGI